MSEQENYWIRSRGRHVTRRGFIYGSGVAAAGTAALLAGCSDDDKKSTVTSAATTAGASASAATTAGASASAATTVAVAQGVKGGTLQMTKSEKDDGLDPAGRVVPIGGLI